jgi:hypothetical protein
MELEQYMAKQRKLEQEKEEQRRKAMEQKEVTMLHCDNYSYATPYR